MKKLKTFQIGPIVIRGYQVICRLWIFYKWSPSATFPIPTLYSWRGPVNIQDIFSPNLNGKDHFIQNSFTLYNQVQDIVLGLFMTSGYRLSMFWCQIHVIRVYYVTSMSCPLFKSRKSNAIQKAGTLSFNQQGAAKENLLSKTTFKGRL